MGFSAPHFIFHFVHILKITKYFSKAVQHCVEAVLLKQVQMFFEILLTNKDGYLDKSNINSQPLQRRKNPKRWFDIPECRKRDVQLHSEIQNL